MYPTLFRIGSFEVTSFGVLVAVGAVVGVGLFRRELRASRLPLAASDAGIVGVIGGLIGAKVLWVIEHAGEAAISELLFS
jgi:prolipoprotein diacylglyceryltransferase